MRSELAEWALYVWAALGAVSVGVLWRLYWNERRYRLQRKLVPGFVTLTWAIACTVIYTGAAWLSFLTVRRLNGLPPIEWGSLVTIPILLAVFSVPIGVTAVLIWQRFR